MRVTDGNTALDLQLAQKLKQTGDNGGINCMGYGLISKYALTDPELPTGSKGLYACVCSTADSKTREAVTTKNEICKKFGISEKTFEKYLKPLIKMGYIIETKAAFKKTIYTIADKPSRFFDEPKNLKYTEKYANIRKYGLFNRNVGGYGCISRAVMFDTRLNRVEKLNYAELCAFAGKIRKGDFSEFSEFDNKDRTAKLKVADMIFHMGVCENTYRAYGGLIKYNYITVFRLRTNGQYDRNIYVLNDKPDVENVRDENITLVKTNKRRKSSKSKRRNVVKTSAAGTPTGFIKPVEKAQPIDAVTVFERVKQELFVERQIPFYYNKERLLAETAVKYMTDYGRALPKDKYIDRDNDWHTDLFRDALTDLICPEDGLTKLSNGVVINYARVIEYLTQFMEFSDVDCDIFEFSDVVCAKYRRWSHLKQSQQVKHPKRAMQTFIWNALRDGKAALMLYGGGEVTPTPERTTSYDWEKFQRSIMDAWE